MASLADSSQTPAPSFPPGAASAGLRAARRLASADRDQGGAPARGEGSLGAERPLSGPSEGSAGPSGGPALGIYTGMDGIPLNNFSYATSAYDLPYLSPDLLGGG